MELSPTNNSNSVTGIEALASPMPSDRHTYSRPSERLFVSLLEPSGRAVRLKRTPVQAECTVNVHLPVCGRMHVA